MAVDARAIQTIRQPRDTSPAIQNLQLAFQNGIVSAAEINKALTTSPEEKLQSAKAAVELEQLPIVAKAQNAELGQQIAQADKRAQLADLTLQNKLTDAEAALELKPGLNKAQQLEVQSQVDHLESILGAQPFARPENAASFFRRTHPGEKVPEDPAKLQAANREAFNAIQQFKIESQRFTGKPTTETFTEVDPNTFDKKRVRVTFDGAGNVVDRVELGTVEMGSKSLTEQQANAVQFSARMKQAQANLDALELGGFDPASISNNLQQTASRLKLGMFATPEAQQYEAAKRNWMAAVLRKESGAAISQSEYKSADHQYFPQPGDSPGTIAQKVALRDTALNTMQAAGLFGLPPAQANMIKERFSEPAAPTLSEIKARHEVKPDSEIEEDEDTVVVEDSSTPAAPVVQDNPVVNSAAEAQQLPPTVEFFRSPDGRIFRNPNFRAQ